MPVESGVDGLLDRMARGDAAAAEELFAEYGPYLRAVVRRRMADRVRAKFDSADVVQSVWVQVVRRLQRDGWPVNSEAELKGLLATIARRRLVSRVRKDAASLARGHEAAEALADVPAVVDRPSEAAQANDVWAKLLALCPPEHQQVLRLRAEGLPLEEIASRTGLHEGSVRRILRQLSRSLAQASAIPAGE